MSARMQLGLLIAVLSLAGAAAAAEPPASPSATPIKHGSFKSCTRQADARKLAGSERSEFLKHCQASKPAKG